MQLSSAIGVETAIDHGQTSMSFEENLQERSEVESEESCIHFCVSETASARPVLRCFPSISRQHGWEKHCYENAHEDGYNYGSRFHISLLENRLHFPGPDWTPGPVEPGAYLGHYCSLTTLRGSLSSLIATKCGCRR
jgi:hypothetical protein